MFIECREFSEIQKKQLITLHSELSKTNISLQRLNEIINNLPTNQYIYMDIQRMT